jgi:Arginase family
MNDLALPWPRRAASPPSIDVALVAIVAGLSLMDVWAPLSFVTREHHRPLLSVVFVATSLALVWRRRAAAGRARVRVHRRVAPLSRGRRARGARDVPAAARCDLRRWALRRAACARARCPDPTSDVALAYLRALHGIDFRGLDCVEVAPSYDPSGITAWLAASACHEMLSLLALRRSTTERRGAS